MELETRSFLLFYLLSKYRFKRWSKQNIKRYQEKKIKSIVRFAVKKSPFFKMHYKGYNTKDFFSLPHVNKNIMMGNLSEYNTLGLKKEEMTRFALNVEDKRDFSVRFRDINIGMSSGTSGNKGIIITTRAEERYLKAMYASRLIIPKKEKLNCAFILRVSSPAFSYNNMGNKLTYVNQLQPTESIIQKIEDIDPNVISAPPSMLKLLAKEHLKGNLKVNPKLIYSYAEILYSDIKNFIENAFSCKVYEIYQGSEGSYAMTCKEGNLHINEDIVFLELYDKYGNPTPDGEPCYKLLVTDLHKRSQPIIRYELNDIITISKKKCKCNSNFRVIKNIQGRANDLIWGLRKGSNKRQFIYQDYISRKIITTSSRIEDFQAIQESYTKITIRVKLKGKTDKDSIKKDLISGIKEVFSKYQCKEPSVNILFKDPIKNKQSNKLSRIISNIKDKK